MLRLIHTQTNLNRLVIDDIDDGLPNKNAHRIGGVGDPAAYKRDGYANLPKQKAYIPFSDSAVPSLPGFIDLKQTQSVQLSAGKGKIAKMLAAGWVDVVEFDPADIVAPTLATAAIDTPGVGDLTLTGTGFESLTPYVTSVILTGTGAVTLTAEDIVTGGGSVNNTSIVIPAALVPGIAAVTTSAQVQADNQLSAVVAVAL